MGIAPGVRLGPYEIVAAVGAGGMGEVYRARDTRLDRIVAIKVLPSHLATDPQLRERFDREARAISSLNHPHICALFDVGHDDVDYLVLEFLEGRTLADRLAAGRLDVAEALRYAIEIADALDKAHRAGIIHRDLKPANVMITKAGAKLLDFGLAKTAAPVVAPSGLSMMPTTPHGVTAQGTILGTFQYMAPEQIEGLEADARTDIFAFGALLFEMLTGRSAFEGKTRASLLGAILKDEPPRVSSVQPLAPTTLDRIVSTCLAKDPEDRFQTARDLVRELNWASAGAADSPSVSAPAPAQARGTNRPAWILGSLFVLALLTAGALLWQLRSAEPAAAAQFTFAPPDNSQFGGPPGGGTGQTAQISVSPNGRDLVFVAAENGGYSLWIRPIGALAARHLAGTEGAAFPFWSPDSRFVAFFAGGKLKKIQPSGGPAIMLCDAPAGRGGTWNESNVILFAPAASGTLQRVSAAGGVPTETSTLDKAYGETNHRYPHFLPDGRQFLFTAVTGGAGAAPRASRIKIGSLDAADTMTLMEVESSAAYASGHLLYVRDGSLMAQPFDPRSLKSTGDVFPIAEQVGTESSRYATFGVSRTGVLVYGHGSSGRVAQLTWYDRAGKVLGTLGEPGAYTNISLSPDQRQVAVTAVTGSPPNRDVWIIDIARAVSRRLTFDPGDDSSPVWSPDGSRIAFNATRQAGGGIRVAPASGAGGDELLLPLQSGARGTSDALTAGALPPADWSKDGKFVAYVFVYPPRLQIWILPMSGDAKPFLFAPSPLGQDSPAFSPDGKWLAYTSYESGPPQVYVQSFPAGHGKYLVSKNSGGQPQWRGDGRELFFATEDSIMAVDIDATRQFEAGIPKMLFNSRVPSGAIGRRTYAVTRDGQRFLVAGVPVQQRAAAAPLTVVVNWLAAVQK